MAAADLAEHFTGETAIPATSVATGTPIEEVELVPVRRGTCVTMSGVTVRRAAGASTGPRPRPPVASDLLVAEQGRQVELSTAEAIRDVLGDSVTWK